MSVGGGWLETAYQDHSHGNGRCSLVSSILYEKRIPIVYCNQIESNSQGNSLRDEQMTCHLQSLPCLTFSHIFLQTTQLPVEIGDRQAHQICSAIPGMGGDCRGGSHAGALVESCK